MYELKIAPPVTSDVVDNLGESKKIIENDPEDEYEMDNEDDENKNQIAAKLFSTGQQCEVCGSVWTERVMEREQILIRCIKHGRGRKEINKIKF